jgi:hypothetical protein
LAKAVELFAPVSPVKKAAPVMVVNWMGKIDGGGSKRGAVRRSS